MATGVKSNNPGCNMLNEGIGFILANVQFSVLATDVIAIRRQNLAKSQVTSRWFNRRAFVSAILREMVTSIGGTNMAATSLL
jgi:hypothetical protein